MFGKTPGVTPLELRKQLLIAESDLNRTQLAAEWRTMTYEVHALTHRVKTVVSWAGSAALLISSLTTLRRRRIESAEMKPSWVHNVLKTARLAASIWLAIRPNR